MEEDLVVNSRITLPGSELQFTYTRSSGPGGQNVNKVNSKATLRWNPAASSGLPVAVRERFLTQFASRLTTEGDLILSSQISRDRLKNIFDCRNRLMAMILSVATPPKARRPTKPTKGSKERRLKDKKSEAGKKEGRRTPKVD